MRRSLIAAALVAPLLAACYMRGHPGAGVDQDVAVQWRCDAAAVHAAADTMRHKSQADRIPKRGWSACDVMGSAGIPDFTAIARNGGETVATWCYQNCAGCLVRQVLLVQRDGAWVVEAATRWTEMSVRSC